MSQDFLTYWKPSTADQVLAGGYGGDRAASNQFGRVNPNDTVWIVTLRSGRLKLITSISVGQRIDQNEASRVLGTDDLWEADYHILAHSGTEQACDEISLDDVAEDLRFQSKTGKDRLTIENGLINPQQLQTMRLLTPTSAALLRTIWEGDVGDRSVFPDEIPDQPSLFEGAVRKVSVNAYERNPLARRKCLDHYGVKCFVCSFDFEAVFGEIGKGFIHVHHIILISKLAELGQRYEIDPIRDLRPLCPNCHAMIHRRNPPFTIDELKLIRDAH